MFIEWKFLCFIASLHRNKICENDSVCSGISQLAFLKANLVLFKKHLKFNFYGQKYSLRYKIYFHALL